MESYMMSWLKPVSEMNRAELEEEIAALQADEAHPYWNGLHPQHKIAVERMKAIHEALDPPSEDGESADEVSFHLGLLDAGVKQKDIEAAIQKRRDLEDGKARFDEHGNIVYEKGGDR